MAHRGSRNRKTADRMAVYKIAADKRRQMSGKTATRTSPRSKAQKNLTTQVSCAQNTGKKQVSVCKDVDNKTQDIRKHPPSIDSSVSDEIDMLDPNTVIPETPENATRVQSRKRVQAPVHLELPEIGTKGRSDSVKPSKKRKEFHTPPRDGVDGEGARRENTLSASKIPETNRGMTSPSRHGRFSGDDEVSESEGMDITVDDLIKAPVPSAQKSPCPLSGRGSMVPSRNGRKTSTYHSFKPVVGNGQFLQRMDVCGSAREVDSLDLMTASSATFKRVFETFSAKVLTEIRASREIEMSEIRRIGTTISDAVAYEIRGLHGLVEMFSGGLKTTAAVRSGGKTSLSDWEKKLDALTPYVSAIFGKKLISRILCCNVPLKCVGIYQKYESSGLTDVERASLSAQTMMFSLQPRDKKFQYSGDVGQLHSDFKFSVVQNCFFNVQRDTFRIFASQGQNPVEEISPRGVLTARVLTRPSWLGEGKVLMDHINQARGFIETVGQTRKDKIRRCPTPDDIACHGALRVYRQLGSRLHDGRGSLRVAFFIGVGYLLVPWTDRILDFDHSSVEFNMEDEDDPSLRLDSIPYTAQCSTNDDSAKLEVADAKNKDLLRTMFAEWPGMILSVVHDVKVSKGYADSSKQKRNTEQKRVLRRYINLIDVACECCVEYCGAESREVFLRTHKSALQCVMIFALLFRALCMEFLNMKSRGNSAAFVPEPTEVKVFGCCLKDFIPGLHTQKSLLAQKCLRLTQGMYEMLNHENGEAYESADEDAAQGQGQVIDMREILESAEQGICAI